jgi:fructose-bisphosphate aldolase class II
VEADEAYFQQYGVPLFSSHMLDLSEEPDEENIAICVQYFKKMAPMKIWLEMEIGITGGEEDGVNNEDIDPEKLYTSPEQVYSVYEALAPIGDMFSIAAAFGNVHGVYKPGNVSLSPEKLAMHQAFAKEKLGSKDDKPIFLVMHGGSGSTDEEIQTAVSAGVVKMNVDTDTQWSYWDGTRAFVAENHDYLQGQIGNPKGPDAPNKKYYDPRVWIRKGEESMAARCGLSMTKLGCKDTFPVKKPESGSLPIYNFQPIAHNPIVDAVDGAKKFVGGLLSGKGGN